MRGNLGRNDLQPGDFLHQAVEAARAAQHIFPEYAACEAALESAWGSSELSVRANNLFGRKQSHPPQGTSLALPTCEFENGEWVTVAAEWVMFRNWQECFADRMALLRRLAPACAHYREALSAGSGAAFVASVSQSWSTDPQRAEKVLRIYGAHFAATVVRTQLA